MKYRALIVREDTDGVFSRKVETRQVEDLPAGDLTIRVSHSSLNYKDALSASGNRGVTKKYPHQPGIDAAGTVVESSVADFSVGDAVIVDGGDLGMNTPGGFGEYIRIPAEWAVHLPQDLSPRDAMAFGTAGFTAALSVEEILKTTNPDDGEILVTGASGGVGSYAVTSLAKAGYQVCAVTGKESAHEYLRALGAHRIIGREEAVSQVDRPLLSAQWAGVVDAVGGPVLARAIKASKPHATVTACGNAASGELSLTVYPFILRGIRLIGIDSTTCPQQRRQEVWNRLASDHRPPREITDRIARDVTLKQLNSEIDNMLNGAVTGRIVVAHGEIE